MGYFRSECPCLQHTSRNSARNTGLPNMSGQPFGAEYEHYVMDLTLHCLLVSSGLGMDDKRLLTVIITIAEALYDD